MPIEPPKASTPPTASTPPKASDPPKAAMHSGSGSGSGSEPATRPGRASFATAPSEHTPSARSASSSSTSSVSPSPRSKHGEENGITRHRYDVVVIGAGGAGLRAAIAAREQGKRTAIVSKSLFGKAHTVMAEGGAAAALGNTNAADNWKVHFRDTLRGGKFLNDPRMAELHAREAPERILELEYWGALFDRTEDGRISQRNFGGHEYPRLAHVGDRTGLELIRTLQQRIVALQQADAAEFGNPDERLTVFAETAVTSLIREGGEDGRIVGAFGYRRVDGGFVLFEAPTVILATGGIGKAFRTTSNSWEYTGDGHALALRAGASLINMEFVQFHPTGMVWPPSVKGILVTESVRGDGGVLRNSRGERFMFDYVPDVFRSQYAETEEEADGWYDDPTRHRRPPELLPRDEVARAINSEVKAGRGSPHGGVFLDVSSRLPAEEIRGRLPSMHHQFKELADVDITAEPMEVGPTCHYVMGGVRVDADTAASDVPGLFAAGEVAGGMHGSNRLGGNSLSDLLVFGRRAGLGAAAYVDELEEELERDERDEREEREKREEGEEEGGGEGSQGSVRAGSDGGSASSAASASSAGFGSGVGSGRSAGFGSSAGSASSAGSGSDGGSASSAGFGSSVLAGATAEAVTSSLAPLKQGAGENPYAIHSELQDTMNDLVGIIRKGPEVEEALERLARLAERVDMLSAPGDRVYNPGWHLALALPNMLLVSEAVARAALERTESRGGHTRDDHPEMSAEWRRVNLSVRAVDQRVELERVPIADIPGELLELFDRDELAKYLTKEELPDDDPAGAGGGTSKSEGAEGSGGASGSGGAGSSEGAGGSGGGGGAGSSEGAGGPDGANDPGSADGDPGARTSEEGTS